MPNYSNVNFVAVAAVVIPAGAIISQDSGLIDEAQMLVCDGKAVDQRYKDDEEILEAFNPPEGWSYQWIGQPTTWRRAKGEIVTLVVVPFGDGFGTTSCGLAYEIDQVGVADAFSDHDFENMATLAKARLVERNNSPEYSRQLRQYNRDTNPLKPIDAENYTAHLVLAYSYDVYGDSYYNDYDVSINFLGQVDLDKIALLEAK